MLDSRNPAKAEVLASLKICQHPAWERQPEPVRLGTSREVRRSELVRIQSPLSVLVHDQFSYMVLMSSVGVEVGSRYACEFTRV